MKKLFSTLMAVGLAASSALGVTLAPGTMETRVSGQFDATSPQGSRTDLSISYGYFFRDNLQAGGRIGFSDDDNITLYSASAFTEYNFEIGSEDWLPFVEGSIGYAGGDGDGGVQDSGLILELQAGIKYFLAPNVALSGAAVLNYSTADIYPDDDTYEDTDARLQLAIRFYY